jgi:hypothetical protein
LASPGGIAAAAIVAALLLSRFMKRETRHRNTVDFRKKTATGAFGVLAAAIVELFTFRTRGVDRPPDGKDN